MKIYHYDIITREYIGESEAQLSPLEEGEFLIPGNATTQPITDTPQEGNIIRRKSDNSAWEEITDIRGTYYKIDTKEEVIIDDLDADLTGLTKNEIQSNYDEWNSETEQWECNLTTYKNAKKQEIKNQAQSEIINIYPLWKQININELQEYTEQEKTNMWTLINSKRSQSDTKESEVNALTTKTELDDYIISFT